MNIFSVLAAVSVIALSACSQGTAQTDLPKPKAAVAGSAGVGRPGIPVTVMNPDGTTSTTTNTVYAPK